MSTGLTWITLVDADSAAPDYTTAPMQFADYSEAVNYSLYLMKTFILVGVAPAGRLISIYTTSPNPKGYVVNADSEPVFVPYE